jgi:hypothetical protein
MGWLISAACPTPACPRFAYGPTNRGTALSVLVHCIPPLSRFGPPYGTCYFAPNICSSLPKLSGRGWRSHGCGWPGDGGRRSHRRTPAPPRPIPGGPGSYRPWAALPFNFEAHTGGHGAKAAAPSLADRLGVKSVRAPVGPKEKPQPL